MAVHRLDGDHLRDDLWPNVREILMEDWDPIGVRDEPLAADEYERYIPKIITLLRAGTTVSELMDYLDEVATEQMGFTSQRERSRPASERLARLAF